MARLKQLSCVLAVAATGTAAVALAAGGSHHAGSVTVGAFDTGAATSRCAGSRHLSLIGVRASSGPRRGLVISGLRPRRGAARATASNVFVNPARLAVTAYCSHARALHLVTRKVDVPAKSGKAGRRKVTATCPTGESVRLAGFRAAVSPQPQGPSIVVNLMRRSGRRSITVGAVNRGTVKGPLKAIAGCGPGGSLEARNASVKLARGGGRATATAECPRGKHVVFGGFHASANDGAGPYLRRLSRPRPDRWRVGAFQFKRPRGAAAAIAYCG
jgi:hypothetical protein